MNTFITGGTGFVGSHLFENLIKQGHKITLFDNLSNSQRPSDSNLELIEGDILDYSLLSKSMKNIEFVVHLAAQINVIDSIRDPRNTFKINVDGTQNVLNACIDNKIKNFIGISTAAVFGNQEETVSENSGPSPISPYGKSKLMMEHLIIDFSKKHNLNSIILRFFNMYGPRQSPQYAGVITKFLRNIADNNPLEVYGDGSQSRDFIHIDDAVRCVNLAIKNLEGKTGRIYNIGSGTSTAILYLASLLLKLATKDLPIQFKPPINGDIMHSKTTTNLAKKELGFVPKITLEEGLSRLLRNIIDFEN